MRTKSLLVGVLLLLSNYCSAQITEADIIERSIEIIAEINEDAEVDYTTLIDDLTAYLERPLDLNTARSEELLQLGFISEIQVNAILSHRKQYGRFIAVEELQSIQIIPLDLISALRYFTKVSNSVDALSISPKEVLENAESELFIRTDRVLEKQTGYTEISPEELAENPNRRFLGSPWRQYMRFRYKYQNRVSIGFTAEKDAGEEFFQGTQKNGYDYYSAHAFISGFNKVDKLALGDFQAQMGQGLVIWSGLAQGFTADLFSIKRNARGITPYRSVDENLFLRGGAASFRHRDVVLTVFGSSKFRDANLLGADTLAEEQILAFSSLQATGFHRTPGELADKNSVRERVAGAEVIWEKGELSVGARAIWRDLDLDFERNLAPYSQFTLNESNASALSVDYDYVHNNFNVFGEIARGNNGALAMVNGAYLVLDPRLTFGVLHRSYSRDYHGVYSAGVGNGRTTANEEGLFMGAVIRIADPWKLGIWVDRFSNPWLRFQADAPAGGNQAFAQLNYKPNRKLEIYARFRQRERPRNVAGDFVIDRVSNTLQHNYRLDMRFQASKEIGLRARIEATDFYREGVGKSRGVIFYQELIVDPKDSPVEFSLRYTLFDTESFDARLYAYERDVLYFYSIPGLSGVGSRYYLLTRYRMHRNVDLWVKIARTSFRDRDSISTGLTEIDGPHRTDLRLQLRIKF